MTGGFGKPGWAATQEMGWLADAEPNSQIVHHSDGSVTIEPQEEVMTTLTKDQRYGMYTDRGNKAVDKAVKNVLRTAPARMTEDEVLTLVRIVQHAVQGDKETQTEVWDTEVRERIWEKISAAYERVEEVSYRRK